MIKPEIPENEADRLCTLRSLDILDTKAEERFDRLTRLARHMFNVPIALVSLVDENRQWFKSRIGLDASETPRDVSFCGHAIHFDEVFAIPDATLDKRFHDNPLVVNEPHVVFYAGCPLKHANGSRLGTLCIIDHEPREFGEEDAEALRDLAAMAERELAAVQLATLDELTRISNRRGFMTLAQNALNICARNRAAASLVYFDLDGFKSVNDTFGHAEGDRALIAFAELMKITFRDSDVFARLGGDEFVALLTNAPNAITEDVIARFRQSVDTYNRESERGYDIRFSAGYVTTDGDHSIDVLLKRADEMMYDKKGQRAA